MAALVTEEISVLLAAAGFRAKREWLSSTVSALTSNTGGTSVLGTPSVMAERVLQLGLDQDLQAVMLPSLPAHASSMLKGVVPGAHILQVVGFVDVCGSADAASKDRENHTFKLLLTDGTQKVTALEVEHITECIASKLYKGLKVAVKDPEVHRGCLILRKHNFTILGGRMPPSAPLRANMMVDMVEPDVIIPAANRSTQSSRIEPAPLGTQSVSHEPDILNIDFEEEDILELDKEDNVPSGGDVFPDSFEFDDRLLALAAETLPVALDAPALPTVALDPPGMMSLVPTTNPANQLALLVDLSSTQASVDFDSGSAAWEDDDIAVETVANPPAVITLADAIGRCKSSTTGDSETFTVRDVTVSRLSLKLDDSNSYALAKIAQGGVSTQCWIAPAWLSGVMHGDIVQFFERAKACPRDADTPENRKLQKLEVALKGYHGSINCQVVPRCHEQVVTTACMLQICSFMDVPMDTVVMSPRSSVPLGAADADTEDEEF